MKRIALHVWALATAVALCACGTHSNPPAQAPQSSLPVMQPMDVAGGPPNRLTVLLGDAAPDIGGKTLERLDIGVREIDAIENGRVNVLASYDEPRVVNVLAHQDDNGESVANTDVSRNEFQQLRLVVDLATSTAKFKGERRIPVNFLVNVASASSSGAGITTVTTSDGPDAVDMLVTQPFSIPADHTQAVRLDFNAFESLTIDASNDVLARPTLFVAPIDDMGSVKGRVLNSSGGAVSNAAVVAVALDGSIGNTDWTDSKGHFKIGTLRSGTYKLVIYNAYTTAAGRAINAAGETTASMQSLSGPTITITGGKTASAGTVAD